MGKMNISVDRVEQRLVQIGKDRAWLERQMEWGKNLITNWKGRGGIPATYAADLAVTLKVTTDWLFEMPETVSANDPAMQPSSFPPEIPGEIARIVSSYLSGNETERESFIVAAKQVEKRLKSTTPAADNKLERGH